MQTKFQQFVKDNQGKLITFLHNDRKVSKIVVNIQGEYFTGKTNSFDSRIDGFYYFSDCKILKIHPLVEALEKNNVSVLNLSVGRSCIFKYNHYSDYDSMINGTCLTTSQQVGFHIDSIKEVLSIVNGKYIKVYPSQEPSQDQISSKSVNKLSSYVEAQNKVLNDCEKVNNALENNKEVTIYTIDGYTYNNFNFNSIVNDVVVGICKGKTVYIPIKYIGNINSNFGSLLYLKELSFKEPSATPKSVDKLSSYFEAQNNVKNACEKVNNTLEKLNNSFDKVFKSVDKEDINYKYPGILSGKAYTRYPNGKVKTDAFYKDGKFHDKYIEYHENGNIKTKAFYQDGKLNGDYYEYFNDGSRSKYIQYKNGLKDGEYFEYDKDNNIVSHRFFKDDVEVTVQKNIKYRGKPKTVEVVNEYKLDNGKEYVKVKDITDDGKIKTLFKDYIEWL